LVVVSRGNPSTLRVLFQESPQAGRFRAGPALGAGVNPTAVAIVDLDGDERLDLAVADAGDVAHGVRVGGVYRDMARVGAGYSILLQERAGGGKFAAALHHPMAHEATSLAVMEGEGIYRIRVIVLDRSEGPKVSAGVVSPARPPAPQVR
jgi:hypothetical protein